MNKSKETVIIVESPAKAKTIERILGKGYKVIASQGHIRDLPRKKFGVNLEDFDPEFVVIPGKEKIIQNLKDAVKEKKVLLASDLDREGEAIAWHVSEVLSIPKAGVRITFSEITPRTIKKAIENVRDIDMKLVRSQFARRILDRIVGYLISPLLWKIFRINTLSAGRVQSATLKIICEREKKIFGFVPKEYWRVVANVLGIDFELVRAHGKKVDKDLKDQDVEKLKKQKKLLVTDILKKRTKKNPPEPLITSTMQQLAAAKLGFSVKKTMMLAQQLYEGLDTKEGHIAFITYHRTDSIRVSDEAKEMAANYIKEKFGEEYLGRKSIKRKSSKGKIQDAHEAIRPVDFGMTPEKAEKILDKDHAKLYKLIWERFLASQMAPSEREETKIILSSEDGGYEFEAKFSEIIFDGFEKILAREERKPIDVKKMEKVEVNEMKISKEKTKPPDRFTEGSLVKEMEKLGIGRPSTYAPTISTLLSRKYVVKKKGRLFPTLIGFLVLDYLEKNFPEIVDISFTAKMEKQLDLVEKGEKEHLEVLKDFFKRFNRDLKKAKETFYKIDYDTDFKCECGSNMKLLTGKFGIYLKCPKCGKTKSVKSEYTAVLKDGKVFFPWRRENESNLVEKERSKGTYKRRRYSKKGSA
ncbi:MAG: type I DNA topoisomerase [Thermotogaceae bacterium]|nr:type I DNA topoisomerase [Thermotogaceae bacterium]